MKVSLNGGVIVTLKKFMDSLDVIKMCIDTSKYLHHFNSLLTLEKQNWDTVIYLKDGCTYFYKYLQLFSENIYKEHSLFKYDFFIKTKSYINDEKSFHLSLIDVQIGTVKNKNVLVLDDICDTGQTLYFIKNFLYNEGAKNVYTHCFFARKKHLEKNKSLLNSYSVVINEDNFIVGMGLDFNNSFRELGNIYFIDGIEYENAL